MKRARAFSYHLTGTLALLALLSLAAYAVWFPWPYWRGQALHELLLVVWVVQLGLGPLLTLILFKPGKRGMKLDLGFIALAQAATLVVSIWTVSQIRPAFVVFSVDRFEVVPPADVELDGASYSDFASLPGTGPRFAVAELPTDPEEKSDLLFSSLEGTGDVHNFARYYHPYNPPHTDAVALRAKPLDQLLQRDPKVRSALTELLGADADLRKLAYVPFRMRKEDMSAIVDPTDGRVLGVVPVSPW